MMEVTMVCDPGLVLPSNSIGHKEMPRAGRLNTRRRVDLTGYTQWFAQWAQGTAATVRFSLEYTRDQAAGLWTLIGAEFSSTGSAGPVQENRRPFGFHYPLPADITEDGDVMLRMTHEGSGNTLYYLCLLFT